MTADLFTTLPPPQASETIADGAMILHGFASECAAQLLAAIDEVAARAPFRLMVTPGGYQMSAAMTSCGTYGWVTDRSGYRYAAEDPERHVAWPAMPAIFLALAQEAAIAAGFPAFRPDSCLINRYEAGSKLSLHQDRDEADMSAPIVSVSLGIPAVFQFGGQKRSAPTSRHRLLHGDIVVWGGPSRLAYHGIALVKPGLHPSTGSYRYNLTFRKAR